MPGTRLGWCSLGFVALHVVSMVAFNGLVASGQRGGETLLDNLWLTVPVFAAGASALAGGATALFAVLRRGERSVLVIVPFLLALFVLVFALGEVLVPH